MIPSFQPLPTRLGRVVRIGVRGAVQRDRDPGPHSVAAGVAGLVGGGPGVRAVLHEGHRISIRHEEHPNVEKAPTPIELFSPWSTVSGAHRAGLRAHRQPLHTGNPRLGKEERLTTGKCNCREAGPAIRPGARAPLGPDPGRTGRPPRQLSSHLHRRPPRRPS